MQSHTSKQVVVAATVILSNICRAWTMYLCMDSVKFLLEVPGSSILWGHFYFVTIADPFWGASIRQGASNRDIKVIFKFNLLIDILCTSSEIFPS